MLCRDAVDQTKTYICDPNEHFQYTKRTKSSKRKIFLRSVFLSVMTTK